LAAALAAAQAEIRGAAIDGAATITTKKGGQYGYTYTSLAAVWAAIRKPLSVNGLSVMQFPTYDLSTSTVSVETLLLHASGQWISNILAMPMADELTPQDIGSGIAYCRRYSLTAIVGVVGEEDDDGTAASRKPTKAQPPRETIAREAAPAADSQVYEHADAEFASLPRAVEERKTQAAQAPKPNSKPGPLAQASVDGPALAAYNVGCEQFAADFPWYAGKDGRANKFHIGKAVAACGHNRVTLENIEQVFAELRDRAEQPQVAPAPEEVTP